MFINKHRLSSRVMMKLVILDLNGACPMIAFSSQLENRTEDFVNVSHYLDKFEFTLGGNWDYEHGYFDRYLDEAHKVWLRIPFTVISGTMDGLSDESDAVVRLGTPFVLKHIYNEGLDSEATPRIYGALFDQFQNPVDKDAEIETKWVTQAKELMMQVEQGFPAGVSTP